MFDNNEDWGSILSDHPIFSSDGINDESLELSVNALSFRNNASNEKPGRRQVMLIKDADLIVALGCSIRMTSLTESRSAKMSYKVCSPISLFLLSLILKLKTK
jgi:nucleoporin NUP82